jgi:hypothetical protein
MAAADASSRMILWIHMSPGWLLDLSQIAKVHFQAKNAK